ncbi:MAG: DinB family protein [Planctomycetota bacterium]
MAQEPSCSVRWPWIERKFNFDFPVGKFPEVLERVRGTPVRVAERVAGLSPAVLTHDDGKGWSIQENIGHLIDVEPLFVRRVEELMAGAAVLSPADMSNQKTHAANYNDRPIAALLAELRSQRGWLVARLEALDEPDWSRTAVHPRLQQPMRLVDLVFFVSEHDDYHLARIGELIRTAGQG